MKYVQEIEGLRGIMSLWVVLGHTLAALPQALGHAPAGLWNDNAVKVFIILSGFVIFWMLDAKKQSYMDYITGRFFRIFPVYILVLIASILTLDFAKDVLTQSPTGIATENRLTIIAMAQKNLPENIIAHAFLLQGLLPGSILPYSDITLVGQAWSLTVEWQFYLIAPLLFLWISTINTLRSAFAITSVVVAFLWIRPTMPGGFIGNNIEMFGVGFTSYFFFKKFNKNISVNNLRIIYTLAVITIISFFKSDMAAVFIWVTVLYSVMAARCVGFRRNIIVRLLASRPVVYLGKISYPVYMVHMLVLFACLWGMNQLSMPLSDRYFALPVACLLLSIGVSGIIHHGVEVPLHAFGKKYRRPPEIE